MVSHDAIHEPRTSRAVPDSDAPEVATLAHLTLEGLRPTTSVLGIVYLFFALAHTQMSPSVAGILVPWALASSLLLLGLRWLLRRGPDLPVSIDVVSAAVVVVAFSHSFATLALTGDPSQALNLIILLVGGSFIILSRRLLVGMIAAALIGWTIVVGPRTAVPPWNTFGLSLIFASAIGFILQTTRLHSTRHLEELRRQADERAVTMRQRARYLQTLISIGQRINGFLDVDALLNHVVNTLHTIFGYEFAGVFLADETGRHLDVRAATGAVGDQLLKEGCRLDLGRQGLVGWASKHRETVCVNDVSEDDRYVEIESLAGTRSEMVVPLVVGETLLGVIDLQSERLNAFSEDDVSVCGSLAAQISTALQNASMYELEHSRRSLMETLYQVGRALSQTLDVGEVLSLILSGLEKVVAFDAGAVALERDGALEVVAARGFEGDGDPLDLRLPIRGNGVFRMICGDKQPLVIPDVTELRSWEYEKELPGTRAWVGLPLVDAQDNVIGLLSLSRSQPEPYTAHEVVFGTAFAGQAGIALNNAQLYLELTEAYRLLRRLDSAKADFITLASHELRTPLTLVTGYSQMLLDERELMQDPMLYAMASGVALGAGRLQEIIDRMMDLAEIESQTLEIKCDPTNMEFLLTGIVENYAVTAAQREIDVILEDLSSLPEIEADADELTKVFRHLVMNAIKYTPNGGAVRISGRFRHSLRESEAGRGVEIIVTDTGIGIDPEHHDHIFDKFYHIGEVNLHSTSETKFQGGGPGLGLAIVKGIVQAHRGDVWVESEGCDTDACPGSSFHVLLPVAQPIVAMEMKRRLMELEAVAMPQSYAGGPSPGTN